MARDSKKYFYITIGIPHNSPILKRLRQESKDTGTSLAKLIPVKLDALYGGGAMTKEPAVSLIKPVQGIEANASAFLDGDE